MPCSVLNLWFRPEYFRVGALALRFMLLCCTSFKICGWSLPSRFREFIGLEQREPSRQKMASKQDLNYELVHHNIRLKEIDWNMGLWRSVGWIHSCMKQAMPQLGSMREF